MSVMHILRASIPDIIEGMGLVEMEQKSNSQSRSLLCTSIAASEPVCRMDLTSLSLLALPDEKVSRESVLATVS